MLALYWTCLFLLGFYTNKVSTEQCSTEGEVRLADGATVNEGRVEICLGGEWGTVCDHQWGPLEARVVCKQLGLHYEFADALFQYGGGSGQIHYARFECSGDEEELANCSVAQNSSIEEITVCSHADDAAVICTNVSCVEDAVRLNDEVVQVCYNQQWGFICHHTTSWRSKAANVVCNEAGIVLLNARGGARQLYFYDGPVFLNDVICTGDEVNVLNCSQDGYGMFTGCAIIGVAQCEVQEHCSGANTVRLTRGSDRAGRLEVCAGGLWGTVCGNRATTGLVNVVCRQLNFASAGVMYIERNLRGTLGDLVPIRRTNMMCDGNEQSISECSFDGGDGDDTCTHADDVIIICDTRECSETDVRLVDGRTSSDGRVEVCLDGLWGSVCDDRWDSRDAQVFCRQLGFDGPSYSLLSYGNGGEEPLIHLDDVHCNGDESTLTQCSNSGIGIHNCREGRDEAGVICTNTTCENGTVHLVGGDDVSRGRVEYCYQGSWYSVCASDWDERGYEARAVCGSLGYFDEAAVIDYGRGRSPILPLTFDCSVDDTNLSSCLKIEHNTSQCLRIAGIDCGALCAKGDHMDCKVCGSRDACEVVSEGDSTPTCNCYSNCYDHGDCCTDVSLMRNCLVPECESGSVRLVGGVTNSTGRLEVCGNGVWGRVCNRHGFWGPDNARVVCRQLGFSEEGAYVVEGKLEGVFGTSERAPLYGEVHCVGDEPELLECSHSSIGRHSCGLGSNTVPDIVISCFDKTSCVEGEVRLRDGFDDSNGRVEYCRDRIWGSVCSEGWDDNDARVLCRQLGYNPDDAVAVVGFPSAANRPIILSEVDCSGLEEKMSSCSSERPTSSCTPAGVTCVNSNVERCSYKVAHNMPLQLFNFGACEVYTSVTSVCADVLRLGIDYIYISSRLGPQNSVSATLNKNIENAGELLSTHDEECMRLILRLICAYYFPPCGNATHPRPPSSICHEECVFVQERCPATWQAAALAMKNLEPFLSCKRPSQLLHPLPNCCTGAGIQSHKTSQTMSSVVNTPLLSSGSSQRDESGEVASILSGVFIFILLLVIILIVVLLVIIVKKRREKFPMLPLGLVAAPQDALGIYDTVMDDALYDEPGMCKDLDDKYIQIDPSTTDSNPYAEPLPASGATKPSFSSLHVYTNQPHIPSHQVRQLTHGKFLIRRDDITLLDCIGEGEFGIVYRATLNRDKKQRVAVKTLKGNFDQLEVDKFVEESLKMGRFTHVHVMGLIGVCLDSGSAPLIIMPFMENGSLLNYLKREREYLIVSVETDEDEVKEICKRLMAMCSQIACGMEYLADEKYIHRDLAARNCMIDANFLIKITDFGLSEDVFERNYFRQGSSEEVVKLPVKWMAPESLSDGHFSEKSDVWSFGVTMWEIFSAGKAPYPGADPLSLMQVLEKGERLPIPNNAACNEEIYAMMSSCWDISPSKRPFFKEMNSSISIYNGCV